MFVTQQYIAVSTITKINTHKSVSNVSFHFALAVGAVPVAWWGLAWHHIYTTVAKPFVTMVTLDPLCLWISHSMVFYKPHTASLLCLLKVGIVCDQYTYSSIISISIYLLGAAFEQVDLVFVCIWQSSKT